MELDARAEAARLVGSVDCRGSYQLHWVACIVRRHVASSRGGVHRQGASLGAAFAKRALGAAQVDKAGAVERHLRPPCVVSTRGEDFRHPQPARRVDAVLDVDAVDEVSLRAPPTVEAHCDRVTHQGF